ncbi:MAG: hypothetical protein AB7Y46_01490 [Armatimonadota bacterium]
MSLALQILGVIFVLLLLAVVVVILVIRQRIRGFVSDLGEMVAATPPLRVTLVPADQLSWGDEAAVRRYADPLPGFGFVNAGRYLVEEVADLKLLAFVHPQNDICAVVYEHPAAGVILDMFTRYADGTTVTYTTTLQGGELRERPGHPKVRLPEADSEQLYRRMLADRSQGERVPVAPEEFAEAFEQAYAEEMDWRLSLGGANEDEILTVAETSGIEVLEEEVEATRRLQVLQAMGMLEDALREHFAEETAMSVAEWERVKDALVFIHEHTSLDAARGSFEESTGEDLEAWDQIPTAETARVLFAALNERLPAERRLRLVGTVSQPLEADVYAPPQEW